MCVCVCVGGVGEDFKGLVSSESLFTAGIILVLESVYRTCWCGIQLLAVLPVQLVFVPQVSFFGWGVDDSLWSVWWGEGTLTMACGSFCHVFASVIGGWSCLSSSIESLLVGLMNFWGCYHFQMLLCMTLDW